MADQGVRLHKDGAAEGEMTDIIIDRIRKLDKLYQEAILTEEEFSTKKAKLLARL